MASLALGNVSFITQWPLRSHPLSAQPRAHNSAEITGRHWLSHSSSAVACTHTASSQANTDFHDISLYSSEHVQACLRFPGGCEPSLNAALTDTENARPGRRGWGLRHCHSPGPYTVSWCNDTSAFTLKTTDWQIEKCKNISKSQQNPSVHIALFVHLILLEFLEIHCGFIKWSNTIADLVQLNQHYVLPIINFILFY